MSGTCLLLVDASSVYMRAMSVTWENYLVNHDALEELVVGMLHKAVHGCRATHMALALDSVEPCWRYEVHPGYKAGREYKHLSPKQLTLLLGPRLRARRIPMLYASGMEADDVLATAVQAPHSCDRVVVYTPATATCSACQLAASAC